MKKKVSKKLLPIPLKISIFIAILILIMAGASYLKMLYGGLSKQSEVFELGTNTLVGHRFAFISNSARELNETEMDYLAKNYDLLVLGNQTKPMDIETKRIKQLNPNIKILMYFPTSIRHQAAIYGKDTFKSEWYLKDKNNGLVYKGAGKNMAYIDLRNPEYVKWARENIQQLLSLAPYDGVVFDNANPIIASANMSETEKTWGPALQKYLKENTEILNNQGKITIFNGIHRALAKTNRSLEQASFMDGALNETFCYGQNNEGVSELVSSQLQIEDIELQLTLARQGEVVLQKVNMPKELKERYGKYCYGLFLMGNIPGRTYFKYGSGYNLNILPDEYQTLLPEYSLNLGEPVVDYRREGSILYRQYRNYFVVVNLGESAINWKNPRDQKINLVPGKDSLFIPVDKSIAVECRKLCQNTSTKTGWCAFKENACGSNGGIRMSEGDKSCPVGRNVCCCR